MAIASATLGGVRLLNLQEIGWSFTPGTTPHTRSFIVRRRDLETLMELRGQEVELNVVGETEEESWFAHRLSILRSGPAGHPDMASVVVSDCRWKWKYVWIIRRYNEKRRTGNRRIINTQGQIPEDFQFTSVDVEYAPYSLQPPAYTTKWEPRDVVRDVMSIVTAVDQLNPGAGSSYVDDNALYANAVNVEELTLDDDGASAVERILGILPGAMVKLDEFGTTHIYNSTSGAEFGLPSQLGAPFVGSALLERVSMSAERPKRVHVHFTAEHELRFDYVEPATSRDNEGRWLRNVMPLPVNMTFAAGVTIPAGTWVEINDELLSAFSGLFPPITVRGQTLPRLTLEILRIIWNNSLYNSYMDAMAGSGANQDPVWASFYTALRTHYRQTFQVNRRWADRILQFLPRRVSLLDPVNNVWGPPSVFANYATIPTYRRMGKAEADQTLIAYNRTPFPTPNLVSEVHLDTIMDQLATTELKVIDDKLGIFHIAFNTGIAGKDIGAIPSNIEGYGPEGAFDIPSANIAAPLKVLSHTRLKTEHALSLVLTAIPAAPNSLDQTLDVTVDLDEAKAVLPEPVRNLLPDALGPELHVHSQVQTARFAWSDTFSSAIESSILREGAGKELCVRLLVNDQILRSVAVAMAAKVYSSMVDHLEGNVTVRADPLIKLSGRMGGVEHALLPDGTNVTRVALPPPRSGGFDLWALLPEWVRRIIKRQLPS